MRYRNCEEIRKVFIADGWSENIQFEEVKKKEFIRYGYYMKRYVDQGHKFFRMVRTGNVFDDTGTIVYYNVPASGSEEG